MEAGVAVVDGQLVFRAVEGKARVLDPVSDAAHGATEVHVVFLILLDGVVAQHDVDQLAFAVWHKHRLPGRAVV